MRLEQLLRGTELAIREARRQVYVMMEAGVLEQGGTAVPDAHTTTHRVMQRTARATGLRYRRERWATRLAR